MHARLNTSARACVCVCACKKPIHACARLRVECVCVYDFLPCAVCLGDKKSADWWESVCFNEPLEWIHLERELILHFTLLLLSLHTTSVCVRVCVFTMLEDLCVCSELVSFLMWLNIWCTCVCYCVSQAVVCMWAASERVYVWVCFKLLIVAH